jgi:hypothetical protein
MIDIVSAVAENGTSGSGGANSNVYHFVPNECTNESFHFMHECTLDYLLSHNLTAYVYTLEVDDQGNNTAQFLSFSTADGTLSYNANIASQSGMHMFDAPGHPLCFIHVDETSAPMWGL